MRINWFPGHMHKARKEIAKVMAEIDVIIEVLDARLPYSSSNPLVDTLRGDTPVLKLLNKSDLADPEITKDWLEYFNQQEGIQALALDYQQKHLIKTIPARCKKLAPARANAERPVRTMIMGIPNVGKSTLINALLDKRIAKVGNEPAVTKGQTRFTAKDGLALSDTPGILWPKIEDQESAYRLATSGAIKDTAIDYEDIALFAADFILAEYPEQALERYKLKQLPEIADQLLDEIGRRRGALRPGGVIDRHKAAEVLLHEIRAGQLGLVSFETVAGYQAKQAELACLEEERKRLEEDESS